MFDVLLTDATLLATGDAAYYQVAHVFRKDAAGTITLYCTIAEWPFTLPAQLAVKDAEIADLRAQVAKLTADPAPPVEVPIMHTEPAAVHTCPECGKTFGTFKALRMHISAGHSNDPQVCETCKQEFKSYRGLMVHRARSGHGGEVQTAPTPYAGEDSATTPWQCAECGSDAFARSLRDPMRCMRCVEQPALMLVAA